MLLSVRLLDQVAGDAPGTATSCIVPDSLDTNVVVYAFDNDEPEKQKRAQELMREHPDAVVSTQVLLEWFTVVTRKFNPPMPPAEAVDALRGLAELDVTSVDAELVVRAVEG